MLRQKAQHLLGRTDATPQLFPELFRRAKLGRQYLTKGVFETFDSGQKTLPGSLQAAGLDRLRRRIQPRADLRLSIEVTLEAFDLQGPIRQPIGRQH